MRDKHGLRKATGMPPALGPGLAGAGAGSRAPVSRP
jgi:hypothetical protein